MQNHTKIERQHLLRKIITEQGIGNQHKLFDELKKHGIDTTQATISRDLQEMGFFKVRIKPGEYKYELLERASEGMIWDRLRLLFHNFVTDVKGTKNLILIKTTPGNAQGIASLIDGVTRSEILGTVAGDDTILVVIDTDKNRERIEKELRQLL
jgi:transcriptional regulator of arginine metabolism